MNFYLSKEEKTTGGQENVLKDKMFYKIRRRRYKRFFQQIKWEIFHIVFHKIIINKYYILFLDGEPATLKATHGVKTPLNVDLGDASLQTNLAVTTRPSAASLNPASPIH